MEQSGCRAADQPIFLGCGMASFEVKYIFEFGVHKK